MSKNKSNARYFVFALVGVLVVFAGFMLFKGTESNANQPQAAVQKAAIADEGNQYPVAPPFTLPDLNGKEVSLSDFKGKVVFLNFWATWCPPCRREIPSFIELINKYGDDGFVVLGVAVDPREFEKVKPFAEQIGINYPVVYDKKGVSQMYGGIRSIPTTFVINRDGKVVQRIVGSRPKQVFESIIKQWL